MKDFNYVKTNSVNLLYLIFSKLNGCFKEINKSKYLALGPINQSKEKTKKYLELWNKIKGLIKSITKNSDSFDKKILKSNLTRMTNYL